MELKEESQKLMVGPFRRKRLLSAASNEMVCIGTTKDIIQDPSISATMPGVVLLISKDIHEIIVQKIGPFHWCTGKRAICSTILVLIVKIPHDEDVVACVGNSILDNWCIK